MPSPARAYRPGDIVKSRKGLFVEIDNTDAEGRLILADALAKAAEGKPELIVDFATLTGAARVALGPDLPATFVNRDDLAAELESAARDVDDPLWRMPLWDPYDDNLKSDVADVANAAGNADGRRDLCRPVPEALRPGRHRLGASRHLGLARRRQSRAARRAAKRSGLRAVFALLERRYLQRLTLHRRKIRHFRRHDAATFRAPYRFIGQLRGTSTETGGNGRSFAYGVDEGAHRLCPLGRTRPHQSADGPC